MQCVSGDGCCRMPCVAAGGNRFLKNVWHARESVLDNGHRFLRLVPIGALTDGDAAGLRALCVVESSAKAGAVFIDCLHPALTHPWSALGATMAHQESHETRRAEAPQLTPTCHVPRVGGTAPHTWADVVGSQSSFCRSSWHHRGHRGARASCRRSPIPSLSRYLLTSSRVAPGCFREQNRVGGR